jgi:LPS-assembly protein
LQDAASPITPPYDRLPQVTARYSAPWIAGWDAVLEADYSRFQSVRALTGQPNANRAFVNAQVSRTWGAPGYYVTPKLQMHATRYGFDEAISTGRKSASRFVPTASVDAGLLMERPFAWGDGANARKFTQTLEPRAFYVRTPFRDQSALPNFDSGASDFNYASVFTENVFGGNDRIADANQITVGLTSRLLESATGAEALRLQLAQRFRFADQRVSLPGGAPVQERASDILVGASVNWVREWGMDASVQYNPKDKRSERAVVGARYNPAPYKVISATYRLARQTSEQVDVSWQWPLGSTAPNGNGERGPFAQAMASTLGEGRWYGVGRLNYSVPDKRVVDAVLGFEYDAGCWIARAVVERLQRGVTGTVVGPSATKRVLFQIEFVGFSRLGNNPLSVLQQNIPRYQVLRENTQTPSRFANYE